MKMIFGIILLVLLASCQTSLDAKSGNIDFGKKTDGGSQMKTYVTIETDKGTIKAELYTQKAPVTTKNFIDLAKAGFYNGLTFHRVEPKFVVQGGDPKGDGTGGSEKSIPLEINKDLTHVKGALGMARSNDPNSARSQFYITLEASHFLDDNYAVFGIVTKGMDVAQSLKVGDKMNKVTISEE